MRPKELSPFPIGASFGYFFGDRSQGQGFGLVASERVVASRRYFMPAEEPAASAVPLAYFTIGP